jgi:hypothetical protein
MTCRTLLTLVAAGCATVLAWPTVANADLFTYRFAEQEERLFRYAGGLAGGGFDGRLEGTFDVDRDDQGQMTIVRFDVSITDPILHGGPPPMSDPDGAPLTHYLIHNPVGLTLTPIDTSNVPTDREIILSTEPRTIASMFNFDSDVAQFRIYSGHGVLMDAPASITREGGFTVELVPEPSSLLILATSIGALAIRRGRP